MSAESGTEPKDSRLDAESPWLGLHSFTEETSSFFFGRSEELKSLFERVSYRQLVVLFGRSGLGKSSLIKAGLIPRLRHSGYLPVWIRLNYDTDTALERQVIDALREQWVERGAAVPAEWADPAMNLWLLFHLPKLGLLRSGAPQVVLIFDQFEEIFTKGARQPEAANAFVDSLAALVENRTPPSVQSRIERDEELAEQLEYDSARCKVLLSLRDDYLYLLERWRKRMPSVMENRMELQELNGQQALRAVVEPGTFRPGKPPIIPSETGEAIVRFVAKAPEKGTPLSEITAVPPPLLSLICEQLNARRLRTDPPAEQIDPDELKGQSEDILQSYYQRCLAGSPPALQSLIEDTLLSPDGTQREGVSEARAKALLVAGGFSAEEATKALCWLIEEERLLSVEERGGHRRIELTHDVLTGVVRRSRELRREQEEAAVLEKSRAAEAEKEQQRLKEQLRLSQERRRKHVTAVFSVLATVACLFAAVAVYWAARAEQNKALAQRATQEAEEERGKAQDLLARSYVVQAEALIRLGDVADAMPYLARSLRVRPEGNPAAALAFSYLPELPSIITAFHHAGDIRCANFSPDGKYVVTASADGTARVWNAATGQPVTPPMKHDAEVRMANFSPDGNYVVTASFDYTARIWDAHTGKEVGGKMGHGGKVYSAYFSFDGKWVVTASADHAAQVWNAATDRSISRLPHAGIVRGATFSPDGKRVITSSFDKTARVWDAATGKALTEPLPHGGWVYSPKFSPDGQTVVTACTDGAARLWDSRTGEEIGPPLRHQSGLHFASKFRDIDPAQSGVYFAEFSPDGKWVATASNDSTARVWDAHTGLPVTPPLPHQSWVNTAFFSPDGRWLVTASGDHTALVWDLAAAHAAQLSGTPAPPPLFSPLRHVGSVWMATFSPDGKRILTTSFDQTARIWQLPPLPAEPTLLVHAGAVNTARFSPDGIRVVTASSDNTARVWDAATGQPRTPPMKHADMVNSAVFSPDGERVVTASADHTAQVWDARTGVPVSPPLPHQDRVNSAGFSPDGKWVVTASLDKTARVWDAQTGRLVSTFTHQGDVLSAVFSPDGKWVVTASADYTAQVWDAQTGKPVAKPLQHKDRVISASFSPDGKWVVTASDDFTARVWDAQTGQPVSPPLLHGNHVVTAVFSPDGRKVVTASVDRTARIWDAATGRPLSAPLQHDYDVYGAQFNPDGTRVVTACRDGSAQVWDVATGQRISQPLQHLQTVQEAEFSPDGTRVVTASSEGTATIWDIAPEGPTPAWLPDVLEAVSYQTIGEDGAPYVYSIEKYNAVRQACLTSVSKDPWDEFGRWLFTDPDARTISPWSPLKLPDYFHQLIAEKTSSPASRKLAGELAVGRPALEVGYAAQAPATLPAPNP
jgi:WD40 repeat protein